MIRIFKLVLLLVVSQVAFGQAPSNYTNINGRYRWIAGMFDSTFHIPKGTSPSLRTGGSTNAGGLFYNTSDSSVYTYTGTQWIKARGSINPSDTTNKYVTQVYKKNGSDSVFYVKGGNHLFAFVDSVGSPGGGGGGKIYYFNGGVNMGTIGGLQMYELGDTANTGAAANFTRSTTGNIANFITDPGKPGLVQIPAGVWSVDAWLSETGGGANHAEIWIEVEKWDGSTITTIATSPIEQITEGSTPNLYSWSVSIPTTSLTVTDRIIIQFYISNTNGKTVTLYTQNGYVGEVHTTFTTGIGAINGLTAPAQYLVTGTSGTDFNINSVTATHTFNLPTASATNRGALSSSDWTTFNSKIGGSGTTNYVSKFTGSGTIGNSQIFDNATSVGIGTAFPSASYKLDVNGNINVSNAVNYSQGGTKYGWTYATSGAMAMEGLQGADISLGTGSGAVATERMVIKNSGNVGIGITPDSMFTVAQGTHLQRGVRMSGLPSAVGTKTLRIDASGTVSVADTLTNGISGSGTTNYIPKFTSSSAIGNSLLREGTNSIGLGYTPSTWSYTGFQINGAALHGSPTETDAGLSANAYYNSGWKYYANNYASQYRQVNGEHEFNIAGIGTAGNSVSFSTAIKILTSGNVGIGTTNPATKLDVSVNTNAALRITNSGQTPIISFRSNSVSDAGKIRVDEAFGGGEMVFSTKTTGGVDTDRMTLNASGNLGLGVTPSAWSLLTGFQIKNASVSGYLNSIYVSGNAYFDGTNWKYIANDAAALYDVNGSSGVHKWSIAAAGTAGNNISFTQAMTLDASGNLGLGTSNPAQKLDVTSSNTTSYASSSASLIQPDGGVNALIANTGTAGFSSLRFASLNGSYAVGYIGFNNTSSGVTGSFVFGQRNGTSSYTEQMRLDASGNLGLGVTPAAWGSAVKALQLSNRATLFEESGYTVLTNNSYSTGTNNIYLTSNPASDYYQYNGIHVWRNAPSGTAGNAISFTQAMTLDASGNLGIGTTNPAALTEINPGAITNGGAAKFALAIRSGGTTYLDIYQGFNSTIAGQSILGSTLVSSDALAFATNNTERMRITSGGNVGIGTTSPTGTGTPVLHINGTSNSELHLTNSTTGTVAGDGFTIQQNGNDTYIWNYENSFMSLGTNNTERMRITSGGSVGIGTTAPGGDATDKILAVEGTGSGQINLKYNGTSGAYLYSNASNTVLSSVQALPLLFNTTNTERMRITSGGELLINTTSDAGDYKLQVNGNGYFSGNSAAVQSVQITNASASGFSVLTLSNTGASGRSYDLGVGGNTSGQNGNFYIYDNNASATRMTINSSGNTEFAGSIKTAAPSGGTAKPFKIGAAAVVTPTSPNRTIEIEIDGVTYYLTAKTTND